ncbi:hypothetical protein Lepto7375DRAFT_4397 [Leptolyngbya sp. PCC 7375]|nr:hypothetical protein Lepto7375DRAFT_4397 [Leptolyngbya sp. PCC 7375]
MIRRIEDDADLDDVNTIKILLAQDTEATLPT